VGNDQGKGEERMGIRDKHSEVCAVLVSVMALATPAAVRNVHSTLGQDPRSQAVVTWRGGAGGQVRYGTTLTYGSTQTGATSPDSVTHVSLSGLVPGTTYYYECAGEAGGRGSFSTAPVAPAAFRFGVIGDVQGREVVKDRWVEQSTWYAGRGEAFWVPVGDLVDVGEIQAHWDAFWTGCSSLSCSSPVMPVHGNHEALVDLAGVLTTCFGRYVDQFVVPEPTSNQYNYYSLVYGDALLIVLNPFCDEDLDPSETVSPAQRQWLQQQLAANTRRWVFVFLHLPVYCTGGHGGADLLPNENALFEQYAVNAVFSGHSHSMSVNYPINNGATVPSYADGVLYYNLAGTNYNAPNDDVTAAKPFQSYLQPDEYLPMATEVVVRADSAVVTTYNYLTDSVYHRLALPPRRDATAAGTAAGARADRPGRSRSGLLVARDGLRLLDGDVYRLDGSLLGRGPAAARHLAAGGYVWR
jgi:hypothetical protein